MVELFANSEDPDQTLRSAESDLGLLFASYPFKGLQSSMGYSARKVWVDTVKHLGTFRLIRPSKILIRINTGSIFDRKGCEVSSYRQRRLIRLRSAQADLSLRWAHTVEPQWLEHLWDHGNAFKTWVVRATEG